MKISESLKNDLPASVVVFFVALPLCLGIALASGAPLFSGLIAGIVGGLVVGSISRSPLGVSGPAAGLAVIVLGAIGTLGFEAFLVAVFLAGLMQIGLGIARAGMLGYFFPSAVIRGMLAGIGVLIVLKQIPHAVGYDADWEGDLSFIQPDGSTTFSTLGRMVGFIEPSAVLVTAISLAILLFWDRAAAKGWKAFALVQGPVVAVVFGIVYQALTSRFAPGLALSPEHVVNVPVVGSLSEVTSLLTHPDWSRLFDRAVWTAAVTIAIVASIETLLCVAATDKLDPLKRVTPTNRELVAQGCGNALSGLIGGLPVTQVIVRSSANIQSGGCTKLSAILHGAWMLIFVIALPQVLNLVPLAVLASVLLVVGYKLAKPALFKQMWGWGASQFWPFVVTILGIAFTDLLTGIGIGLGVAVLVILKRNYVNSHFLHIEESGSDERQRAVNMRLSEEVTFLNKGAVLKELNAVPDGSIVTIDTSSCIVMDHDILEVIEDFRANAAARGVEVRIVERPAPGPVRRSA